MCARGEESSGARNQKKTKSQTAGRRRWIIIYSGTQMEAEGGEALADRGRLA